MLSTVAAFVLYFLVLVLIGFVAHKKNTTEADFVLGGRKLNFWVTALSAHASDMSVWLFMGFPMAIFMGGLSQAWIAFGLVGGMFLSWQFLAPAIRTETEKYDSYTLSTYLERRFKDTSGVIRLAGAGMIMFFMLHYLAIGLTAVGFLFEDLFQVNYYLGITIALVAVTAYTWYGGYISVAWTDLFQGLFLMTVLLLIPLAALKEIGGIGTLAAGVTENGRSLSFFHGEDTLAFINALLLAIGWGLGYFGQPHIISKFMGISDPKELYKSKWLGISWQIIVLAAATLVGLIGIPFFSGHLENPEFVLIHMVRDLFPPFFAGLMLCGIFAAALSTMDAQVVVCAGVWTEDLYRFFFKDGKKKLLSKSRMSVLLTAALTFMLACDRSRTILDSVYYAWAGLGCSFGPVLMMSLYYPRTHKYGVLAGVLVGGLTVIGWPYVPELVSGLKIPSMIPGFFLAVLAIYLVSLVCYKKEHELRAA